jgi:pimeloyl-ACP methyl ester carboxylesterase
MAYADNRGVRIHYRIEGSGPPLVLQHGFTQSIDDWYEPGYVDALKRDYRLVLVDARGHGDSDKPHEAGVYPLENRVGDVVAVLDALAIEKAHFWGYSMGGWIGFGMAEFAPKRVDRLVIGGQHPYARNQEGFRQMVQIGITHGPEAFVAAFEQRVGTPPPGYRARLHQVDHNALLAAAQDRPSFERVLPKMAMPCCLYAGDADPLFAEAKSASELIPHVSFFSLPELSHLQAFVRADLVLPRVTPFLRGTA